MFFLQFTWALIGTTVAFYHLRGPALVIALVVLVWCIWCLGSLGKKWCEMPAEDFGQTLCIVVWGAAGIVGFFAFACYLSADEVARSNCAGIAFAIAAAVYVSFPAVTAGYAMTVRPETRSRA